MKGKQGVLSRSDFLTVGMDDENARLIEFVSLQDMKGSIHFGNFNGIDKLEEASSLFMNYFKKYFGY